MRPTLVIATRKSPLALKQADYISTRLSLHYPSLSVKLLGLTTTADERLDITLNRIGGKGLFVKELEEALLDKRADIAVHSMKDMPMILPDGLILPVITAREDASDAFLSKRYDSLHAMPTGARIGTASLRRVTQLRHVFPQFHYLPLRGNVGTRLARLSAGDYDAIILATAGLNRLGLHDHIVSKLPFSLSLPAAGQGALAIECRALDEDVLSLIKPLHDNKTAQCVLAERALCQLLEGGCQVPLAAYAELEGEVIFLRGLLANADGSIILKGEARGEDPIALGERVASGLLQQGARAILDEFKQ